MRRIVLVGATGTFGSRLARLLCRRPDIGLVLAARRRDALDALRATLTQEGAVAALDVRVFDRSRPEAIGDLDPWLVVDAAGPFQGSGYALPLAAVRHGAHYVDLADARAFVAGFADAVDAAARDAGVLAVTAASTTPALSHAALETLVNGWRRIDEVVVAISPGARAPRGRSVVEAILSYAGRPVRVFRGGGWATVPGWSGLHRLDMPGLGRRFASICETPDLDLLPARFAVTRDALFLAGLELAPMHLGLAALSLPVRWRLVPSLLPLSGVLRAAADLLAVLGSDRGGMIVEAAGLDEGAAPARARWALWAEANAGPDTPVAPAAALIRALAGGGETRRGALPCVGLLALDDILVELAHLPIRTRAERLAPGGP